MTKLKWDRARRNPSGYVSVGYGPEEIAGSETWIGGLKKRKARKPKKAVKTADPAVSPVQGRAWPHIKDGTGSGKRKRGPEKQTSSPKDHLGRLAELGAKPAGAPANPKKELRREVLAYLIRMGPGRTEFDLAKALYGSIGCEESISKDCAVLVRDGVVERKAKPSDPACVRYFPKK